MSFLKKLTKEFEGLKASHDEKKKHEGEAPHGQYAQPQQQYAPPAPSSSQPQLPPGWTAQFDNASQRWFYIEVATGRTQWEPPYAGDGQKGFVEQHAAPAHSYEEHRGEGEHAKKNEDPKKKILKGLGGLMKKKKATGHGGGGHGGGGHGGGHAGEHGEEHGKESEGSEASSVKSARESLEEAQEAANDSDAGSSEQEELEEAQEEYEEEVEESED